MEKVRNKFILQKAVFQRVKGKIVGIEGVGGVESDSSIWDFSQISFLGEETVMYPDIPKPLYYYAVVADNEDELKTNDSRVESSLKFRVE